MIVGVWIFVVLVVAVPSLVAANHVQLEKERRANFALQVKALASDLSGFYLDNGRAWPDMDAVVQKQSAINHWSITLEDSSGSVVSEFSALNGEARLTAREYVLDTGGALIGFVGVGTEEFAGAGWFLLIAILLPAAALAGLFGGGMAYFLTMRSLRPITEITRIATVVGQGNFSERVPETGVAETTELATSINGIAKRLEEVDSQRRTIMAEVVHELRRPLTNVQGFTGMMQDQVVSFAENLQETVSAVYRQVQMLSRQMDGLRLFAAADSGELELNRREESVEDLIAFATDGYDSRALERGVTLSISPSPGLPPVLADRDRIVQVIGNLLDNSLRHLPQGGEVVVSAARAQNEVVFSVADTGDGIRPDVLPHIFERFYTGDTKEHLGFGLGLTIVNNIIQLHGGRVWAESEPGHGAVFRFTLPIHQKTRVRSRSRASAGVNPPGQTAVETGPSS